MSVYVDQIRLHSDAKRILFRHYCHMFADTTEELTAFAVSIGMHPSWIQHPGTRKEHFDLTPKRRARAREHGALEITTREWLVQNRVQPGIENAGGDSFGTMP